MKSNPTRMDIASRKTYPKDSLLRFVRVGDKIVLDDNQSLPGRGCYLHKSKQALQLAQKKNLFARHLHCQLDEELLHLLEERL